MRRTISWALIAGAGAGAGAGTTYALKPQARPAAAVARPPDHAAQLARIERLERATQSLVASMARSPGLRFTPQQVRDHLRYGADAPSWSYTSEDDSP